MILSLFSKQDRYLLAFKSHGFKNNEYRNELRKRVRFNIEIAVFGLCARKISIYLTAFVSLP